MSIRLFSLLIAVMTLLCGCNSNKMVKTVAIVWLQGGVSQDNILFEVRDDKTIRSTKGNVILDVETKEIHYGDNVKFKTTSLNTTELSAVNELLLKISEKEVDIVNPMHDIAEVFALVDNKLYWTPFYDDYPNNKELLGLAKLLLETASLKMD